ncbi:MAG: hypothetical protein ACJAYK_002332 [Crocinitomicaceae bacterium]|jgi:hypothetical protein
MSRNKKSRSLKRVTGGVETGSKERTKLEKKQNKARKKATANIGKENRQRSVYQKAVDDEKSTKRKKGPAQLPPLDLTALSPKKADSKKSHAKQNSPEEDKQPPMASKPEKDKLVFDDVVVDNNNEAEMSDEDLFDLLENPGKSDNF